MTVKKKTIILTAFVSIAVAVISLIQFNSLKKVEIQWQHHIDQAVHRKSLLSVIESQFGYGGFIHNFKNHVLRGQAKFIDRFEKNKTAMMKAIQALEELSQDQREKQAITDIKRVAEKYSAAIGVGYKIGHY